MFLARIRTASGVVPAVRIDHDRLLHLDGVPGVVGDDLVEILRTVGTKELAAAVAELAATGAGRSTPVDESVFEVPVPRPQKIVCAALNYAAHAEEGDQAVPSDPVIFFKPPSSLLPHGRAVRCPAQSERLDFEVELAVVIGTTARDIAEDDWSSVVIGYTVLNDMTARDLQLVAIERNQPWDHSKAFDTFAPCGPYLVTPDEIADPMDLDISLTTGGQIRQQSNTGSMVFGIPRLISVISAGITLEPGDIIATGTPSGIGMVADGDVMVATVEGVGSLVNPVTYERRPAGARVNA